ncbi:hypothetical protein IC582_010446 [Cucumis melo]
MYFEEARKILFFFRLSNELTIFCVFNIFFCSFWYAKMKFNIAQVYIFCYCN